MNKERNISIDADSGTILLHRLCDKESDGQ